MTSTYQQQVYQQRKISRRLPLSSIIITFLLLLLIYFFLSGGMYKFYASVLFLFYAGTKMMWVSVILLGIFQTLLLVPLRVTRVIRSDHINEFQKTIEHMGDETQQLQQVKQEYRFGNKYFLFYLSEWIIQMTTFLTIGRLFLTDFYSHQIPASKLYHFVPYPAYPIKDIFFKIPYPKIATTSLGWEKLLIIWAILLTVPTLIAVIQRFIRQKINKNTTMRKPQASKYALGTFILSFFFSWLIAHYFPTGLKLAIFRGNISIPNRTLNLITAIVTFATLLWFGVKKIYRKSKLAREKGIDEETIDETQKTMFSQTLLNSLLIGSGAYFLTNLIPSAFELSIFTLEIISLLSPLTLDRLIFKVKR